MPGITEMPGMYIFVLYILFFAASGWMGASANSRGKDGEIVCFISFVFSPILGIIAMMLLPEK